MWDWAGGGGGVGGFRGEGGGHGHPNLPPIIHTLPLFLLVFVSQELDQNWIIVIFLVVSSQRT